MRRCKMLKTLISIANKESKLGNWSLSLLRYPFFFGAERLNMDRWIWYLAPGASSVLSREVEVERERTIDRDPTVNMGPVFQQAYV
jgi:hypothetical protein